MQWDSTRAIARNGERKVSEVEEKEEVLGLINAVYAARTVYDKK